MDPVPAGPGPPCNPSKPHSPPLRQRQYSIQPRTRRIAGCLPWFDCGMPCQMVRGLTDKALLASTYDGFGRVGCTVRQQHYLLARSLVANGVPLVMLTHKLQRSALTSFECPPQILLQSATQFPLTTSEYSDRRYQKVGQRT